MKTGRRILISVISVIAVLGVGLFVWTQQPSQVAIAITGQSGLAFTGVIKADGTAMAVSGVVPTSYVVSGRWVDCRFWKQQAEGTLGINMRVKRLDMACSATTPKPAGGVCAFFHTVLNCGCYTF